MGHFKYGLAGGFAIGNKGFIGRRVIAVPSVQQLVTLDSFQSTGPWGSGSSTGAYYNGQTNFFQTEGAVSPDPALFGGFTVAVIGWCSNYNGQVATPNGFSIGIQDVHPQNFFTKVSLGAPVNKTFLTAAVDTFNPGFVGNFGVLFTQWAWIDAFNPGPFVPNVPITFT